MIAKTQRELRKRWHLLRRRLGLNPTSVQRLVVKKATWLHDALSPVMLMVDDLANAWHNRHGIDTWEPGGDWGGGLKRPDSAFLFLENGLLRDFPEVKVTFFTVAGPLSAYTHHQPFSHAAPLDADEASRHFFSMLASDPRFELAYHGFDHGSPGARTEDFVQEWRGFPSTDAAIAQTRRGLDIFARATGLSPQGGKYGGWDYNGFAEEAVDHCGFLWWCRDWTPRDVTGRIADDYYEPQFFGRGLVVGLPSTVHGKLWDRFQIDLLLSRRQIIAVEEHIAPVRPDGQIQTPNIVDDLTDLRNLFRYLRGKKVWHATGSEIASYVIARERSLIFDVSRHGFAIHYEGRVNRPLLSLLIDCSAVCTPAEPLIEVTAPDGTVVDSSECSFDLASYRHLVTTEVMEGRYTVRARAL